MAGWFYSTGKPTPEFQAWLSEAGFPKIVQGVPLKFPRRMEFANQVGCLAMHMHLSADGTLDKFMLIDSKPEGAFDQSALQSLYHWKFEAPDQSRWFSLRISFQKPGGRSSSCIDASVALGKAVLPANVVKQIDPLFPADLARRGVQGCATLSFDVSADGLADNYEVIDAEPADIPGVVQASAAALNEWRFDAPEQAASRGWVRFDFRIKDSKEVTRECRPGDVKDSVEAK